MQRYSLQRPFPTLPRLSPLPPLPRLPPLTPSANNGIMTVIVDTAVGVTFGKRQLYVRNLVVGQPLRLVPEPTNPYDSNAVAIWNTSEHLLGYVSRQLARALAERRERGKYKQPGEEGKGGEKAEKGNKRAQRESLHCPRVFSVGRCSTWGPYGFRFQYELDGGEEDQSHAPSRKRPYARISS